MEQTYTAELNDSELYDFLINAPKKFRENERIKKFQMKNGDFIHCILWNYHFYISGTDIVKILIYRFQMEGRQINNLKKFEEGIFSDLRNLKPGIDATLEGPRSDFLEFLYKNGCIRTQKKQKVFFWYSVPHDALFCDAMERDMRRETFFVASKSYASGIFNNTKTNRNVTKQRASKSPVDVRNAVFGGFEEDMFSRNNNLLNKTLFQEDQMTNIIRKNPNKKSTILDDIVNYNTRKSTDTTEKLLFTDDVMSMNNSNAYTELEMLINSADLRIEAERKQSTQNNIESLGDLNSLNNMNNLTSFNTKYSQVADRNPLGEITNSANLHNQVSNCNPAQSHIPNQINTISDLTDLADISTIGEFLYKNEATQGQSTYLNDIDLAVPTKKCPKIEIEGEEATGSVVEFVNKDDKQ